MFLSKIKLSPLTIPLPLFNQSFHNLTLFQILKANSKVFSNMRPKSGSVAIDGRSSGPDTNDSSTVIAKDNTGPRDHLRVTAENKRDPDIHDVKVINICDLSPTVKKLILHTEIRPVPFSFKPGQWVDVFIPGVDKVGGFSMTSSSTHLQETGNIHLAVKRSDHPPAKWVHSDCKKGSTISIRVGGDFFLDIEKLLKADGQIRILLIAGGVGINPLASMVAEIRDFNLRNPNLLNKLKTSLLFSAKTSQELLFRDKFDEAMKDGDVFKSWYFITTPSSSIHSSEAEHVKNRRINSTDVEKIVKDHFNLKPNSEQLKKDLFVYLCGPPEMITSMNQCLTSLGTRHIYFENWWQ